MKETVEGLYTDGSLSVKKVDEADLDENKDRC
jgi:hypothetical protein